MEKQTLYKFFNGEASPAEKKVLRTWLEASPEHEKELFREREFFDAVILAEDQSVFVKTSRSNQVSVFRKITIELIKVAAILAIVIGCGYSFYQSEMNKLLQGRNIIHVPAGQRVNLTLPDGTNVWLNARSEMQYPAVFSGSKREITLNGEAYFNVTHNEDKPFVVHTDKCNIEVLGTKFNVEAYSDSEDFSTALMEGAVKVYDNSNPARTLLLSPNHQATFVNNKLSATPISDFDQYRWKEGLICFLNVDFEELMTRFEKSYGIQIVIQNKSLHTYVCSGKFRISDGIDNALRILQKDAKYTFERNKENSVIYIK